MGVQAIEMADQPQQQATDDKDTRDQGRAHRFADPSGAEVDTWEQLVRCYEPYLMRVAASYKIGEDARDVVQHAFLRLLEHGDRIRDPQAVRGWLATVVRNECLRLISRRRREQLYEHDTLDALLPAASDAEVDIALLQAEGVRYVQEALQRLPSAQRRLLELLVDPDPHSYRRLAEQLQMPMGSIGPTRQRALARLKATLISLNYDVGHEAA